MRLIAPIIFGLCVTFASLAQAEQWSKTFPITGNAALRVDTSDANIHVDTWDEHTIEARVTTARLKIGEGGVKVTERHSADSVELEVRLPHNVCILCVHSVRSPRVEIEIHMPREGRVNLRTGDGSIQLSNLKGDMDIQSSDGGLEIDSVEGSLKAHTGDSSVVVTAESTRVRSPAPVSLQAEMSTRATEVSLCSYQRLSPQIWIYIPAMATLVWTCQSAWKDSLRITIFTASSTAEGIR